MIDLLVELKATTLAFNQKVIESSDVAETLVKVSLEDHPAETTHVDI